MRGKQARTVSSPPQYERVIWVEEKTARGSKIIVKPSHSPRTPKVRKLASPYSKKRKFGAFPTSPTGSSTGGGHPSGLPVPIYLKTKPGKVSSTVCIADTADKYLGSAIT